MALELLVTDEAVCLDKAPGDPTAKVVKCDSDKAAFQLAGKGTPISKADAERFGVKTKPAELGNYTLRLDSHTIARTPEEKAYAATQPQPGLVAARADQVRSAASMSIASLASADMAKSTEAADEAKKADEAAEKRAKATLEDKMDATPKANKTTTRRTKTTTAKTTAKKSDNG